MAKKKTVVTTPNKRPEKIGAEITLDSPELVDAALEELGWCVAKLDAVDAQLKELHDAIELKRPKLVALAIGDVATSLPERCQALDDALMAWAKAHLKSHLASDEERTLKLEHGSLSYRKLELSIEPQEGLNDAKVLDRIDKLTTPAGKPSGALAAARKVCKVIFNAVTKLLVGDLVKLTPVLNREGMIAAYKAKTLDDKTLKSLGLVADDKRERYSLKVK